MGPTRNDNILNKQSHMKNPTWMSNRRSDALCNQHSREGAQSGRVWQLTLRGTFFSDSGLNKTFLV
jgi:hypothetical protein